MIKRQTLALHILAALLSPILRGINSMDRLTKYRVGLKRLAAMSLGAFLLTSVGACASQSSKSASTQESSLAHESISDSTSWPASKVSQRDFPMAAALIDRRAQPWKLWLISSTGAGMPEAMEFFTGERVSDVHAEQGTNTTRSTGNVAYSFIDSHGRRYSSVRPIPSRVDTDQPSAYAGWEHDGQGHEVVLGAYLFDRKRSQGSNGVYTTTNVPVDPRPFLDGQRTCDPKAYVARTQGSESQDSEPGFVAKTRIIADYNSARTCWNTRPTHAVNLGDNTFLIATETRVFRVSSKDLSPVGAAPDIRIINIEEK